MARRYCRNAGRPFTTSYHTRFPEYLSARLPVPEELGLSLAARFPQFRTRHAGRHASRWPTISPRAASPSCRPWTRGVDTDHFRPDKRKDLGFPRPDLPLRRPRRHRKEPDRLPRSRPARQQGDRRRRTGTGQAQGADTRRRISSATGRTTNWPKSTPRPMSSSSPAAPTRSATSSSRRWPAARRSPPIRSPARSTSSATASAARCRPICARRPSPRSMSTAPRRANAPCATAGKPAPRCSWTRSNEALGDRRASWRPKTAARRPAPCARWRRAPPRPLRRESPASALPT